MRVLNSLIVPKYKKRETLWAFWHFSLLQNIKKKLKVGPFEGKKIEKNVAQCRKKLKQSHSADKNCWKKFLAKARTRTRDRWVHRKPSKGCTDEYT